ncbi:hypothetical protein EPUS_01579 [Endocarpon pusillum Z07020]|uniref:DNA repair protein Rad26 n=1 Tax=Endocarpon pusillum (strain Z07020 / HMAS-L-300199) TaxID=1263415 RepID=U1I1G5_ENDPU|nr:uncharacterized protein EPUS_01579 [Endocarpon pusillum Z07020]ERF75749.1 hypothetical protein EPUS_01579 [Endocarpon pusillum Z07020]
MNGMDDNEEEDNFFADDFDDLPDNAWDELEQNAIQSTQHPQIDDTKQQTAVGPNSYLGNVVYRNVAPPKPARQPFQLPINHQFPQQQYAQRQPYVQPTDTSVYEDNDIPTPVEEREVYFHQNAGGNVTEREQWRQQRYGEASRPSKQAAIAYEQPYTRNFEEHELNEHNLDMDVDRTAALNSVNDQQSKQQHDSEREEALRSQIAELLRERDDLTKELQTAKSTVMTQMGEISIIRANQAKDSTGFDRQLVALKKSIQEEAEKHKRDIEATNKRSEKISNDNQFLQHELKEELEKIKALQKNLRDKEARLAKGDSTEGVTTPKKTRQLPLRDGFDDQDIAIVSPVKSGRKSKPGTPTNAGKRKRKVPDASPVPALTFHDLSTTQAKKVDGQPEEPVKRTEKALVIRKDTRVNQSLQFMQRMLNHRLAPTKDRILEVFSQYAFPSDTKKSFTSVVLEESASLSGETLPSGFTKIIIALWAQALKEKYYMPIAALIEVVQFILALESSVMNSGVIQKIVPVLQSSTDVNGTVRFNNSPVSSQNFGQSKETPKSELNDEVDGTETLDMLYTIACSCVRKPKLMEDLWRTIDSNSILMMLNVAQPITDLTLTLNLLATSITPTTFGTIKSNETDQQKNERYLVDRVAYLLWETPRVDEGAPHPTKHATYQLRMEALSLLSTLAFSSPHPHNDPSHHGSLLLATHPSIIGRLVRFIYDTLDALYAPIEPASPLHSLLSSLINRATLLLYRLLELHGKDINLHEKLTAISGGVQKHRVVLTRLAFSEGLHLESGITDETVAMAHEMLEEAVTPEEAEALIEVFPGFKGRGGGEE